MYNRCDVLELKNAFKIMTKDQSNVILYFKTSEEKTSWMADLIMLKTKSILERALNTAISNEESTHPLILPSPNQYIFAEPDNLENIVIEDCAKTGVSLIKGATLNKLVERLTYHLYPTPTYMRTFLITYRCNFKFSIFFDLQFANKFY